MTGKRATNSMKVERPNSSFIINVLNEAVSHITTNTKQLEKKELLDIFGGRTVFQDILHYHKETAPLEEMQEASAYLIVSQILLYQILTKADSQRYRRIDEDSLKTPEELSGYFRKAINYTSTFSFDIVSRLPESAMSTLRKVIKLVRALQPEKIRHDVLGKVFHNLIPLNTRKAIAAFYTNNEAAEMLAQLAIDDPDAKIYDLAVGSGTLLVASYHRKKKLLESQGKYFTSVNHRKFLEEDLTGIDVMPFAAHLAAVHLSLQNPQYKAEKVRIAIWDSTELKPGQTIPAVSKQVRQVFKHPTIETFMERSTSLANAYIEKGVIALENMKTEEISLTQADVVIMNPPFTRQERLPTDYKSVLAKRLKEYADCLHGQLGLCGYFVLIADRFTKKGGRIALVLPASILRVKSGEEIRRFLVENYHIEYLVTTWQRAAFSEVGQFREILLVAKKLEGLQDTTKIKTSPSCKVVTLKKLPRNLEEANKFVDEIKTALPSDRRMVYDSDNMTIRILSQIELKGNFRNLFTFMTAYNWKIRELWSKLVDRAGSKLIPLNHYLNAVRGEISRGIETKSSSHVPVQATFILRNMSRARKIKDVWVIKHETNDHLIAENRFNHKQVKIPFQAIRPGLRRLSRIDIIDLTDEFDFVVVDNFPEARSFFSGKETDTILKLLPGWKKYVERRLANLSISRRFDVSGVGTMLFAWYSPSLMTGTGLMWSIKGLPPEVAKILTLWFNSTPSILQMFLERVETRGVWMQLHKYALNDLMVLNPTTLSECQTRLMHEIFDKVRKERFPSFLTQLKKKFSVRVEIDKAILSILGFEDDEINEILDFLYPTFAKEIDRLKDLLKG